MNVQLHRLETIRRRIESACAKTGRNPAGIRLLAVSKMQPAALIRQYFELGQRAFGENKLQEALRKQAELTDVEIEWHFIGPVQSNKTRDLAAHFDWVQSVDRPKIARRLSAQRPPGLPPLNVCLQVNIDREPQKSGVLPEQLADLAGLAGELPNISLRGLMAIPSLTDDAAIARQSFARMRHLYRDLIDAGYALDTLSMGMSADLELAIQEGSNMVRVGTDLLGPRPEAQTPEKDTSES
jgi:pyridoxal phosphate enzyme (YggS family)